MLKHTKISTTKRNARVIVSTAKANIIIGDYSKEAFESIMSKKVVQFAVGDKIKGTVVVVDKTGAWIDVGAKSAAFLPAEEASLRSITKVNDIIKQGSEWEFVIINDEEGKIVVSLKAIEIGAAWERVKKLYQADAVVECDVISVNRGGLVVELEGIRGFMPLSHVNPKLSQPNVLETMAGKTIPAKFLDCNEEGTGLVMSNRKAISTQDMSLYTIGSLVNGTVSSIMPYGAFIQVDSINGLLHISQISEERIQNVENFLKPNDQLKLLVIGKDMEKGRLALSLKKLEPNPGDFVRNPQIVFDKAEEMAAKFREQLANVNKTDTTVSQVNV